MLDCVSLDGDCGPLFWVIANRCDGSLQPRYVAWFYYGTGAMRSE